MPRLLQVHFASIGHADARLAPLTIDLRSRDGAGTGADSLLWLRNGGGKSTILNLFYSVFRPDRRDFLGASAEGKARHLEDYVKADDLAFVVTEWDVQPTADEGLFPQPPKHRRIVGQMLAWRDRQRSSDHSKLRRRYFSLVADAELELDRLPIEGLGAEPVRSFDAFRTWLDGVKQTSPEREVFHDDMPRRWHEHLEKIGLDPELFRYQLLMNAREGSADEAFRFRTTDDFVRFFLDIAFDSEEADKVSNNLDAFRDRLGRRPSLLAEQAFLVDARHHLLPLLEAMERVRAASASRVEVQIRATGVMAALTIRVLRARESEAVAAGKVNEAASEAAAASNDAARLGRWSAGLERRAVELDVREAEAAHEHARRQHEAAAEAVLVAKAGVARDKHDLIQCARDAKAEALRVSQLEHEPLRQRVVRAGTDVRVRLAELAETRQSDAAAARTRAETEQSAVTACETDRSNLQRKQGGVQVEIRTIDDWLEERERARERLRADNLLEVREDPSNALTRWQDALRGAEDDQTRHTEERSRFRGERETALTEAGNRRTEVARLSSELTMDQARIEGARRERDRLQTLSVLCDVERADLGDLGAPGLIDRLNAEAEAVHRRILAGAVEGAEDDRALQALDRSGRLPPTADVELALSFLADAGVTAFSGTRYLTDNVHERHAEHVIVDPAVWHGVVVLDASSLEKARFLLRSFETRMPVTIAIARLGATEPPADRVVLPGNAAHWDRRVGAMLRIALEERQHRRQGDRDDLAQRERACREAARDVAAWRAEWGDGRLAVAESDLEQKESHRDESRVAQEAAEQRAAAAGRAFDEADSAVTDCGNRARAASASVKRVEAFIERYEAELRGRRTQKDEHLRLLDKIDEQVTEVQARHARHGAAQLVARDSARAAEDDAKSLLAEHDRVDLHDDLPPSSADLPTARALWSELRRHWHDVVSADRLQWELQQLEEQLRQAAEDTRELAAGRESALAKIAPGGGAAALVVNELAETVQLATKIETAVELRNSKSNLAGLERKRRDADDLPAGELEPANALAARDRAERCRTDRDTAYDRRDKAQETANESEARRQANDQDAAQCELLSNRLGDIVPPELCVGPAELPESLETVAALVDSHVKEVQARDKALNSAQTLADERVEALREVALAPRHEKLQSRVKERLKGPLSDLTAHADELHGDVEVRLEVVRATLEEIDSDRRMVLQELDKVAMDGVTLLRAAEKASRLPSNMGAWDGESFLRIHVEVPKTQAERVARLEPLVDRLVDKGVIPAGRELVHVAVAELAGHRVEATILKPDAVRRRDRLPVTEMQTFSRGQQLTVAIVLYCTMARLRGQQRGRGNRPDSGVLLLDNPVGTCSSVPLLNLQREVARQMRVQLVYTTGVNDPDAVATFPNTVRLRNSHRARRTGDQHVTQEGLESVRVVST